MGVLTQEELDEKLKKSPSKGKQIKQERVAPKLQAPAVLSKFKWLFFHPENPADSYKNFKINVKINNEDHEIACNNGQVETDKDVVAEYLTKSGYILIKKLEVNPDVIKKK